MTQPVVTITPRARDAVLQARSGQEDSNNLALWLEVDGDDGTQYLYDLYLMHVDEAGPGDVVQRHDDLSVVIPQASVDAVSGATIDLSEDPQFKGWVLDNPNRPPARAPSGPMIGEDSLFRRPDGGPPASPAIDGPAPDLTGDVAQRVRQIIEHQINPSIASHGGRAELVALEEGTAFLRLGGGCQGCAMASVTLTQGIKVAITDAVPEVTEVVDVTDHQSGDNPYFQSAKK
jgi:Fe/S biogenesis protein NfuA